jgi:membrane protein implicated in regulation of membrane protease activity
MNMNDEQQRRLRELHAALSRPPQTMLGKLATFAVGASVVVLALMFSLVAFAVIAVGGTIAGSWLWWKTRDVRKQMREQAQRQPAGGHIIEGEVIRADEQPVPSGKLLN